MPRGPGSGARRWKPPTSTGTPQLQQKVWSHRFVLLILRIRGVVLPWAVVVSLPKAFCPSPKGRALELPCKTRSQPAADLLQTLPEDLL